MNKYIVLENITKSYKNVKALDGISLEIEKGKLLAILGPPGSGKTTLLKIIAGLERQDSGHVYIDGKIVDNVPPYGRKIAMVFETLALYSHLTVYENIASPLLAEKKDKKYIDEKVREISKILKIEHILNRRADKLSGGERQRVALARAIAKEADIYLFDEPFANLDAKIKYSLRTEFKKLKELLGKTIILATSDPLDALALGDEVVILKQGRIIQSGNPVEVYEKPVNIELARYLTGKITNELVLMKDDKSSEWRVALDETEEVELELMPEIKHQLNKFNKSKVTVVSYPHMSRINVKIDDCKGLKLRGKYLGYEYRGSEFLLYARTGSTVFSSISTNLVQIEHNSSVYICFDRMLFYDSMSGNLLG
ncbi:MAG: ABC transporter ATP-binding protein [Desulfurococcaceae archaeon]